METPATRLAPTLPSGDPTPSPEDLLITEQIVAAGKLLNVDVLDHLVIGQGRYCSMREKGLGFSH
jgi:DNA repair protein RadC